MIIPDLIKQIADKIKDLPDQTQLSIGIVNNRDTNFCGMIKRNGAIDQLDNADSAFEISSVTKSFTGNVLARLAIAKEIQLDDLIQQFLPFPLPGNPPITLKQLALHTSGLPKLPAGFESQPGYNKNNPYKSYTEESLISYLTQHLQVDFPPGSSYQYSNLGAGLLGYILSRIEKAPFAKIVAEKIFIPLGMDNSCFDANDVNTELVKGIDEDGNICQHWDGGILDGGLGIISTAKDLLKFAMNAADKMDAAANLQAETNFEVDPGLKTILGWGERKTGNVLIQGINGGTQGSAASIMLNREKNISIVVLSNINPACYMDVIYPIIKHTLVEISSKNNDPH